MYLHRIYAKNFRVFGDGTTGPTLDWELNQDMNILVGENDSGKTAIVDTIRQILWTTTYEYIRIQEADFHCSDGRRCDSLVIEATLRGLSDPQQAAVLEWLTYGTDGTCSLVLNLQARLRPPQAKRRLRVDVVVRTGPDGIGPEIGGAVRDLVRCTYLRPLRDAEAELGPGRQSRLSQILGAHNKIAGQENNDFDAEHPTAIPKTLTGLMAHAQHHIGAHPVIREVERDINDNHLRRMSFKTDPLTSEIRVSGDLSLPQILERFELGLLPPGGTSHKDRFPRGLGYSNALFMAAELVLLREGEELALLLVEEPEAHLHPQLQTRVLELLEEHAQSKDSPVQVLMTTHSPSMAASAPIESMTLVQQAQTYRLRPQDTRLAPSDYEYLRRFIDATKSNLFFARGVAIVEGPAEALLLPAIAEAIGLPFAEFGISVVNVGDVGLFHYARIFQRQKTGEQIAVPVACITDRDIVPVEAKRFVVAKSGSKRFVDELTNQELSERVQRKKNRVEADGCRTVRVFVSDHWTFEYDLAAAGCAKVVYTAIQLAEKAAAKVERLTKEDEEMALGEAQKNWPILQANATSEKELAATVYQPLAEGGVSKAITAQYAAKLLRGGAYGKGVQLFNALPSYLQEALKHLTGQAPDAEATKP